MIPDELKRSIDRYKERIPSDAELTALFDEINSAKLKPWEPEEVCNYLEKVMAEAPAKIEEKERQKKNYERAKKKKEEEHKKFVRWEISFFSMLVVLFLLMIIGCFAFGISEYIVIPAIAVLGATVMTYRHI